MGSEKVIRLDWIERENIKSALSVEIKRMEELRDYAIHANLDKKIISGIENGINSYRCLVAKMRDDG